MAELSLAGIVEVLRHIPNLRRRLAQCEERILELKPEMVVTIDAPGFTFRLMKALAAHNDQSLSDTKLVHYVAPTVWAWKPKRAEKVAKFLDHLLVLLPFEPPYFERHGLGATFVGHPVVVEAKAGSASRFRDMYPEFNGKQTCLLLPGSRRSEIERLIPVMADCWKALPKDVKDKWSLVVPVVDHLEEAVQGAFAEQGMDVTLVRSQEKWDAFHAAECALAASGTVALELAATDVACIIAYKVNPITAAIVGRMLKVKFVSLINIQADQRIQPEFIQGDASEENILPIFQAMLSDANVRSEQVRRAKKSLQALQVANLDPSEVAADKVLSLLGDA